MQVDVTRHELLADTTLTLYENGERRGGDLP